jgi:hypothetical protein
MSCGRTHESNCSAVRNPRLKAASCKRMSWYAVNETFAAFSYPMGGLRLDDRQYGNNGCYETMLLERNFRNAALPPISMFAEKW